VSTGSYQDLIVWRKGIELAVLIYRVTDRFPRDERFGLVAQLRRAAASISSNISEGWGAWKQGGASLSVDDFSWFFVRARVRPGAG
jgi:hypothetical protein